MNYNRRVESLSAGRHDQAIDRVLRDYFQSQLPEPWPDVPTVQPLPANGQCRVRRTQQRYRLALAAALALFIIGFWSLAQFFPSGVLQSDSPLNTREGIGQQPQHPDLDLGELLNENGAESRTVPTRGGGAARMWENHLPNNRVIIKVEEVKKPSR